MSVTVCKNMQKVASFIEICSIFLIIAVFVLFIPQAFAYQGDPIYHMQPEFDGSRSGPFTGGLIFVALVIIGVCIFLIILWRKSNPARIKWLCLFIALSALLIFSIFRALGHLTF